MQRGPAPSTKKILIYCLLSIAVLLVLGVIGANMGR